MPPDHRAKAAAPVVASISGTMTRPPNADPPVLNSTMLNPITLFIYSSEQNELLGARFIKSYHARNSLRVGYFLFRRLRITIKPPESSANAEVPVDASISGTGNGVANAETLMLINTIAKPIILFMEEK